MGDIGQLPTSYRIPASSPSPGVGPGNKAPQRKPASEDRQSKKRRQQRKENDDDAHIDEYA